MLMRALRDLFVVTAAAASSLALAQSYPSKTVRMIVPFPPGGTTDILGRLAAQKLSEALGHQVIVDNRPGAGGNIGAELAAKSPADGYTLLAAPGSTLTIHPSLYAKLPFDPLRDFAPITMLAAVPNLLVVHPSLPVKSVKDLIALAKAKPGELNYASTGAGQSTHLSMELFKNMAGVKITHVPYKGSAPAISDLMGGHVLLMFDNMPSALPQAKAGKLRGVAVSTSKRSPVMPSVPTVSESGLPGFEVSVWFSVLAPANTPREIIDRLNAVLVKALHTPDMRERLASQGAEAIGNTPEAFAAQMKADIAKWAKVVRDSNIKLD
ncbi:MAG TPA: tripartite tricarboxylate transporter substrate binding protein [Burkholderiales bacterium]|nr:tripartite tricarboxylate transporter substrate binding protein [Burkholderiales bacterium]